MAYSRPIRNALSPLRRAPSDEPSPSRRPTLPLLQLPNQRQGLVVLVGATLTGAATALSLKTDTELLVLALVGGLLLTGLALVSPPTMGIGLIVVFGSLAPDFRGFIRIAGLRTDPGEILFLIFLSSWVVRRILFGPKPQPYLGPILLLTISACIGSVVGVVNGAPGVLGPLKSYALFLIVLPLTAAFEGEVGRDLLETWVIRVAFVASLGLVVLTALGKAGIYADPEVTTYGVSTAAQRVRAPVLQPALLALVLMSARIARDGATPRRWFALALFGAVALMSFNRSTWAAFAPMILLAVALRPGRKPPLAMLRGVLILGVALAGVFSIASSGTLGPTPKAISVRAVSTFSRTNLQDSSFLDRQLETKQGLAAISRSPLVGVGMNVPYGATRWIYVPDPPRYVKVERLFSHNSFLELWLRFGILGVIAMGWLFARLGKLVRAAMRLGQRDVGRALAGAFAALGFALQALFQPNLHYRPGIVALSCALVLAAATPDREPEGSSPQA